MHPEKGGAATKFGQHAWAVPTDEEIIRGANNVLLQLVDWVEKGVEPEVVVGASGGEPWPRARVEDRIDAGVKDLGETVLRKHCRYPRRSVWNGTEWGCVP